MAFAVRAITLDLDDTVWPFAPIGVRIERVLDEWMRRHSPATAEMFTVEKMRALRERIAAEHPALGHDMSALRRLTLEAALRESGGDVALADAAYEAFFAERNRVECYPDAIHALERISARLPIAALSNGNADLARIGLDHLFTAQLSACSFGSAKPDPAIFLAACERLGVPPAEVLHVGDHPDADVAGAARAGLRSCWINRADDAGRHAQWRHAEVEPDLHFDSLAALADWLDAALPAPGDRYWSTPA
ncbi:HAD family hydrolase [Luteimonas terricola]|uniref:Hydrolase n=1 Tax=Luteimonas terricola TaxID=645597 RepID=A0ABQ2E6F0_9GAMM|nr:HAD-IA family hydrolase [Luteimonas terricola]GGJ98066.1 hydrolase [Luteimonas terricola]